MGRQVAVTHAEPRFFAQLFHCLQAVESITAHSPATLATQQVSKYVHDRIDVRRNIKTPPNMVVASIHDEGDLLCGKDPPQTVNKLRASSPAGQDNDHAALRA